METSPGWMFDEKKYSGVDYSKVDQVARYDSMHRKFRDYGKASEEIIKRLSLDSASTVIDMGSGTGAFALNAARSCHTIYAVDISPAMLEYCRGQAEREGLENILFRQGGLLTYEHDAEPVDAIVCVAVLHHLPDFWKATALSRCREMLKPEGRLYLFDIVFPSTGTGLPLKIDKWIEDIGILADSRLAEEALIHVKDEFSTFDWIMEGIIGQSGFRIDAAEYAAGFQTTYVCTKNDS